MLGAPDEFLFAKTYLLDSDYFTVLYPTIQQPGPEQRVSDIEVYELSTREVINISKAFSGNIQCVKRVRYSIRDLVKQHFH